MQINNLERTFLHEKFLERYPRLAENVQRNSNAPFTRIVDNMPSNERVSPSTWRNLFHRPSPYIFADESVDSFYRHLLNQYRQEYLENHPEDAARFAIPDEIGGNEHQNQAPPQYPVPIADTDDAYAQLKEENETLKEENETLKEQLQEYILWYKPPPIEEEVKLKDLLPFVNDEDSAFRRKMKSLVLSLMKGYAFLKKDTEVKLNPSLKWYKEDDDMPRHRVYHYLSKDGYDFGIDKVTWTGFDKEGKEIETIAHQLFSDFANTILGFKSEQLNADFLNNLLDIDSQFCTAIIIYVGFVEKDITLMARYPAFSEDIKTLGNLFVLNSRPWWRNAKDMNRREAFSWTDSVDNQLFTIGVSKPYQTIRANAPNERCLWIEVPIEDSATMIIGIDLLKNDNF